MSDPKFIHINLSAFHNIAVRYKQVWGCESNVYKPPPNVVLDICELVNNAKIWSQQKLQLPTELHLGLNFL